MQGINTTILQLGENISGAINDSKLPPVCVKIVLENMLNQIIPQCNQAVILEQQSNEKEGGEDGIHESELE
ncbi:hypothetical protein [Anaerosporobacter sp.]